mmetsp:Transcript_10425/g.29753  ORF Transcript_10425/g.29753 Transcript_10425/m.29753 type:complete len:356 (-) Transcript_10425:564-1631(-)
MHRRRRGRRDGLSAPVFAEPPEPLLRDEGGRPNAVAPDGEGAGAPSHSAEVFGAGLFRGVPWLSRYLRGLELHVGAGCPRGRPRGCVCRGHRGRGLGQTPPRGFEGEGRSRKRAWWLRQGLRRRRPPRPGLHGAARDLVPGQTAPPGAFSVAATACPSGLPCPGWRRRGGTRRRRIRNLEHLCGGVRGHGANEASQFRQRRGQKQQAGGDGDAPDVVTRGHRREFEELARPPGLAARPDAAGDSATASGDLDGRGQIAEGARRQRSRADGDVHGIDAGPPDVRSGGHPGEPRRHRGPHNACDAQEARASGARGRGARGGQGRGAEDFGADRASGAARLEAPVCAGHHSRAPAGDR